MSEHFNRMWSSVNRAITIAMEECDPEFVQRCHPIQRDADSFAQTVETAYRRIRGELRLECYGTKDGEEYMDARKIASVMCCALMEQRAVCFDTTAATNLLAEKNATLNESTEESNRTELNRWIVNNYFINYKIAYLTGIFIVFDALMTELLKNSDTVPHARTLAEQGQPSRYPINPKVDGFDVSMVLGLGRAGMQRIPINAFLLALHFYQIEMYTRKSLGVDN